MKRILLALLLSACAVDQVGPAPFEADALTEASDEDTGESPSAVPDLFEPDNEPEVADLPAIDSDLTGEESENN